MTSSNVYLMGKPPAVIEYDHEDLTIENEDAVREVTYMYEPLPDAHHFRLLELSRGNGVPDWNARYLRIGLRMGRVWVGSRV